jgi:hypothetical protein
MDDQILQLAFSIYHNPGVYALLLGAGISYTAGIPTGWDVMNRLIEEIAQAKNENPEDPQIWYEQHFEEKPTYGNILERIAPSQVERNSILKGYFEPTDDERKDGMKLPTQAHKAIASLVKSGYIKVILTTNFDRLLEKSLEEEGITPDVISSDDMVESAIPLQHSPITIVKLHGDYRDWRSLNTSEELATYSDTKNKLLDRVFDEYGLIVCGWSAEWDTALRDALYRTTNRRYTTYWAAYDELQQKAADLVHKRRAKEIKINGADEFFEEIEQNVDAVAKLKRHHPLSIAVAVERVKKLIPQETAYIELEELIGSVALKAYEEFNTDEFLEARKSIVNQHSSITFNTLEDMFPVYLSRCEISLHMLATLSRYGHSRQAKYVTHVVSTWLEKPKATHEDNTLWRFIPAIIAIYVVGIAATHSGNWEFLNSILVKPTMQEYLPRTHYTMSNLIIERKVRPFFKNLIPSDTIFHNALDLFSMMLALVHLDTTKEHKNWMPLHRTYLTSRSHEYIKEFWAHAGKEKFTFSLLQIGLFDGDSDRLAAALETYVHLAQLFRKEQRHLSPFGTIPDFAQIYRSGELI